MCTLLVAHGLTPDLPLVIAANRDERYSRPTRPAAFWDDAPGVVGGRDEEALGTWLGVTRDGRWAALTNVREPGRHRADAPSRGALVRDYLTGPWREPGAYLEQVAARAGTYNGFNLVVGTFAPGRAPALWYLSNRAGPPRPVAPGVHGISNDVLDTPWPKVRRGREALARIAGAGAPSVEALMRVLADRTLAPDDELPDTGVGLPLERSLSPLFILGDGYGTCCSTVVIVSRDASGAGAVGVTFVERATRPGAAQGEAAFAFHVPPEP